jgi:hypothetical protein
LISVHPADEMTCHWLRAHAEILSDQGARQRSAPPRRRA